MTKEHKIERALSRGVEALYPNPEKVKEKLEGNEQLRFYLGIDPTGPTLHVGHLIPLIKLRHLQDLGHEIILLIGDMTATIGDPDKLSVRKPLTREEVLENAALYREQASRILLFSGDNAVKVMYNSTWLSVMNFSDVLMLASHVTVQQLLERDMFARRIQEERPIYVHEFLYPLMQGYDAVAMDVDGEVGGNDQTFNMLTGRTLLKQYKNKEKLVIVTKLIADNEGVKMGKTTGNMVAFNDSPRDMFGKIMSLSDAHIVPVFELCTFVDDEEIAEIAVQLATGTNPRDLKIRLAQEIVSLLLGEEEAENALLDWQRAFQEGGAPEDIPTVEVVKDSPLVGVVCEAHLVSSRAEWRRLIDQGAVTLMQEGGETKVIDGFDAVVSGSGVYKIGKHRFLHCRVK
ncbi:MAG: tyrosine--tRNA ligase [bacterium]|nr:tyrosine--tRNA ligase [bacterium]